MQAKLKKYEKPYSNSYITYVDVINTNNKYRKFTIFSQKNEQYVTIRNNYYLRLN